MKLCVITALCFATMSTIIGHPATNVGSSNQNLTSTELMPNGTGDNPDPIYSVTIYTNDNFFGMPWTVTLQNCTDVPFLLYKKTSSVDTHDHCMLLFGRQNCTGRHVRIEPGTSGHSHLSQVGFDDSLASLKPCPDQPSNVSNSNISISTNKPINGTARIRRNIQFENFIESITNQIQLTEADNNEANSENNDSSGNQQDEENGDENESSDDESNGWFPRFRRDTDSNQPLSVGEMETVVILTATGNVQHNNTKRQRPPLDIQNIFY